MNSSKIFKRKAADPDCKKASFTLAETLLTLAIIGIVAAMVMPALMTKCNSFIWSTGQDLFEKKLDVAMRMMNTNDTVEGYDTTESFANELKNNIKITEICTGDNITNCFPEKIIWTAGEDPIEVTSDIVHYVKDNNQDWAETVGVRFNNGVEALIAYDKNCTGDPFNNQFAASECIGVIYDVSGHKIPNTKGKDISSNSNVLSVGGDADEDGDIDTDDDLDTNDDTEEDEEDTNTNSGSDTDSDSGADDDDTNDSDSDSADDEEDTNESDSDIDDDEEDDSDDDTDTDSGAEEDDDTNDSDSDDEEEEEEETAGDDEDTETGGNYNTDSDCLYTMSDGTCITKILKGSSEYGCLTYDECTAQMDELGLEYCYNYNDNEDCYAGAAAACGGTSHMLSQDQLILLAQDLYNTSSISSSSATYATLDTEKAEPFISAYGFTAKPNFFSVWSSQEYGTNHAYARDFNSTFTYSYSVNRTSGRLAVCVDN